MGLLQKIKSIFSAQKRLDSPPEKEQTPKQLSTESRALHEAAHGIVWYLFKDNWTVNRLTINSEGLPDESMKGALHITAKFNVDTETNIQRANEISAIALAGIVGQNIEIILQRDMITLEIAKADHFKNILDTTGCGGDFEIVNLYLSHLSQEFNSSKYSYVKYKIMDLVSLFQEHQLVQRIHRELTQLLIEKGSLEGTELIDFLEKKNFQEYVEYENLDINFFHQR